jgi:hypothetical protein
MVVDILMDFSLLVSYFSSVEIDILNHIIASIVQRNVYCIPYIRSLLPSFHISNAKHLLFVHGHLAILSWCLYCPLLYSILGYRYNFLQIRCVILIYILYENKLKVFEVLSEYMEKSQVILPCLLYVAMIINCLKLNISCLESLLSLNLGYFVRLLSLISFSLALFNFIYWAIITRQRQLQRNCFILTKEEYYCWVFKVSMVSAAIWGLVAGQIWHSKGWHDFSINLLVSFNYIPLVIIVFVTGEGS